MNQASSFLCDDILQQIFFTHSQQSSTALFGVEGEAYWREEHRRDFERTICRGQLHPILEAQRIRECYEDAPTFAEWYFNWGEEAEVKVPYEERDWEVGSVYDIIETGIMGR